MKTIAALTAALLAAAPALAAAPNSFSEKLRRLPDIQQRAVMRRAILDDARYCKRVNAVAYQQSYKNLVMWTARCDRNADYAAFIGPDGSVQVRPCGDLARLKLPLCRFLK